MSFVLETNSAMLACWAITGLFVGSLYIWNNDTRHDRDHPETIKRRFISAFITCILSTILVRIFWIGSNLVNLF
jgi:hypothetical protein